MESSSKNDQDNATSKRRTHVETKSPKIDKKSSKVSTSNSADTLKQTKKNLENKISSHRQKSDADNSQQSATNNKRTNQRSPNGPSKSPESKPENKLDKNGCSNMEEFAKQTQELKHDIYKALERQSNHQDIDPPVEIVRLREDVLKLSGLSDSKETSENTSAPDEKVVTELNKDNTILERSNDKGEKDGSHSLPPKDECNIDGKESSQNLSDQSKIKSQQSIGEKTTSFKSDELLSSWLTSLTRDVKCESPVVGESNQKKPQKSTPCESKNIDAMSTEFESLNAKLDPDSKFIALQSSLQKHFAEAPQLLEPVCRKLISMSEQNSQLTINSERYREENQKLTLVKQKLENLCRELQKSNNAIRIESLDLIKVEQSKAKEQTAKIQSTLSGVIKLFDENQQRNMSLRQENQELQTKLKSLLDHCDNWGKSVDTTIKKRDIENRLLRTELAKANLLKNEEREKFLKEKQELLHVLSMMQEQQHKIEGQEAKLRSDLSSYASKYDECQAVISKGMSKFQTESKRMLKQLEQSRHDYKALLTKFEASNRRIKQLLEEKHNWDKTVTTANKKVETLEKLCRALKDRKMSADSSSIQGSKNSSIKDISHTDEVQQQSNEETKSNIIECSSHVTNNQSVDNQSTINSKAVVLEQ